MSIITHTDTSSQSWDGWEPREADPGASETQVSVYGKRPRVPPPSAPKTESQVSTLAS